MHFPHQVGAALHQYVTAENVEAALDDPLQRSQSHARKQCQHCPNTHFNEEWGDNQDSQTIEDWAINAKHNK
jgi:hypothetical protein